MIPDDQFAQLIARIRDGDKEAASELARAYEPEIRRAARLRLSDPEMRRLVDSIDISQSVFGRFFNHVDRAEIDVQRPEQLLALLTKMAGNRIIDEHRRLKSAKRGGNASPLNIDLQDYITPEAGPRTDAISREMLNKARSLMSDEELELLDRRNSGESWDAIAAETGGAAGTLRKRLERALQRVRDTMGGEI